MIYNPPVGGGASDPYVTGNPSTGTPGSIPPGAAIEDPQREIISVITAAGLTPSAVDMTQLLQAIQALSSIPAGFLASFAGTAAPTGWAACGTAASTALRATFPRLNAALEAAGYPWGAGDGATTFGWPWVEVGGAFVQGGAGAAVGTQTSGSIPAHTHTAVQATYSQPDTGTGNSHYGNINGATATATGAAGAGTENLAAGSYALWCVKT